MKRKTLLLTLLSLMALPLFAADMTDAEWAQLKREYLERPRRVMIDDDGCDAVNFPKSKTPSVENFYAQMLDMMPGNEFDVLVYCPGAVGFSVLNRSKYDRQLGTLSENYNNITQWLTDEAGADPVELARRFARKNGYEFVLNMRANDIHDAWYDCWLCQFKKDHPEYLVGKKGDRGKCGQWSAYDFAHQEVRERFIAYVKEWFDNYDPDGFLIDYYRNICFFKSVYEGGKPTREEMDGYTAMLRELREYAEEVGRKRGRPIYFAFRLPDSVEICELMGLDVRQWMKEGLLDIFIAGGDLGRFTNLDVSCALCKEYGVKFYASVDSSWIKPFNSNYSRNNVSAFNGYFSAAYAAGAEGVYMFNMFYYPAYFSHVRRNAEDLVYADKAYFVTNHSRSKVSAFQPAPGEGGTRVELGGGSQRTIARGDSAAFEIEVGDDLASLPADAPEVSVLLYMQVHAKEMPVVVLENDVVVGRYFEDGEGSIYYKLPVKALHKGVNRIVVAAPFRACTLCDMALHVKFKRMPKGPLADAAWAEPTWLYDGDYSYGVMDNPPGGSKGGYHELPSAEDGQGVLLDHDASPNAFFSFGNVPGMQERHRFMVAEWEVTPVRKPKNAGEQVFQLVLRPLQYGGSDNRHYEFMIRTVEQSVVLANGSYSVPRGTQRLRAVIDCSNGEFMVFANRKLLASGSVGLQEYGAGGIAGDCSSSISGACALKNLRLGVIDGDPAALPRSQAVDGFGGNDVKWDLDFNCADGDIPPLEGLVCSYSAQAIDSRDEAEGIILDNDDNDGNIYPNFITNAPVFARECSKVYGEFKVEAVRAPSPDKPKEFACFQAVYRPAVPGTDGKRNYELPIRCTMTELITPWDKVPAIGPLFVQVEIDCKAGTAVISLNGKQVSAGTLSQNEYGAGLMFGDCSVNIGGAARLEFIRERLED